MTAVESTEIGGAVGRIRADDPDVGRNAEMEYTIVGGHDTFNIITDQMTQEGVVIIKKVRPSCCFKTIFCQILCCCRDSSNQKWTSEDVSATIVLNIVKNESRI